MTARHLNATHRAARIICAALSNADPNDLLTPLREARDDGRVTELVLALALQAAYLARDAYGDQAQTRADGFAFDALNYGRGDHGGPQ